MSQEWSESQLKWYDRIGKARPTHISHGINAEDIEIHMKELRPHTWQLSGNVLTGETDMGPLVQNIPTDYIMTGIDDEGLPVFKKVVLQDTKEPDIKKITGRPQ